MEETKSLICTRCGSQHLEKQSETEYKCLSCDAIITKEKAVNFEKEYRKLLEEGKSVDIKNLRNLMNKALEGHIDKVLLVDTCTELLRILPEDVKATSVFSTSNPASFAIATAVSLRSPVTITT